MARKRSPISQQPIHSESQIIASAMKAQIADDNRDAEREPDIYEAVAEHRDKNPPKSHVIHTYFEPSSGIHYETELRLLLLWQKSWQALGYKTVVLNEWHARQHPKFDQFMAKILTFPSVNGVGPESYETRCYQRHLCGELFGGVFTDHDLMPRAFQRIEVTDELTLWERGCPSMIVGNQQAFSKFVTFILDLPDGHACDTVNGQRHASDMYLAREAKLAENPVVKQFTEEGWEAAPFIHFSHHSTRNHRPRHEWIPKLMKGEA